MSKFIQMKYHFRKKKNFFFLLTILLINCKKDEVDFRDNIVGTYRSTTTLIISGYKNYVTNLNQYIPLYPSSALPFLSDTLTNSEIEDGILVTKFPSDASKLLFTYPSSYSYDTFKIQGSTVYPSDAIIQIFNNKDSIVSPFSDGSITVNQVFRFNSYTGSYLNNQLSIIATFDNIFDIKSSNNLSLALGRTTLTGRSIVIYKKI